MRQSPARNKPRSPTDGVTIQGKAIAAAILTGVPVNGRAATSLAALLEATCAELNASLRYNGLLQARRTAAGPCTLRSDQAILVQLIVREAVTNAINYAHPTGIPGQIAVTYSGAREGSV